MTAGLSNALAEHLVEGVGDLIRSRLGPEPPAQATPVAPTAGTDSPSLAPTDLVPGGWTSRLRFVPLPPPSQEEIEALTATIARRLTSIVERSCSEEFGSPLDGIAASMQQVLATALRTPVHHRARLPLRDLASLGRACSSASSSSAP